MFFGADATSYAWWDVADAHGAFEMDEPNDWWVDLVIMGDADYGEVMGRKTVSHGVLMATIADIAENGSEIRGLAPDVQQECAAFLDDPDDTDFDADMADQVLQHAVLGEVVFG